jgi:hypothetical protein
MIRLEEIRIDGDTQPRAEINETTVNEYRSDIDGGETLPPADVYYDGTAHWMADGFHRFHAYYKAGHERMPCTVHKGTQQDAQWHAVGSNKAHGLRRTNADKEKAVRMALKHPQGTESTNELLADHVGVSPKTVAKYRTEMESTLEIPESSRRTGKDGRSVDTTNIGAQPEESDDDYDDSPYVPPEEPDDPPDPPCDPFNNVWTDQALADIKDAVAIKQDLNELNRIAREWKKRAEDKHGLTKNLDVVALGKEVTYLKQRLKRLEPYCLCPMCDGDGCKLCRQNGWLTKEGYKLVPEDKQYG